MPWFALRDRAFESRRVELSIVIVKRRVRIDAYVSPQRHLAVHVDDAAVVVEQVRHESIHVHGDEPALRLVGGQIVIDRIAVKHGVEIIDAHVAVPAIAGVFPPALMPLGRVLCVALPALDRAVAFHITARQQSGFAGHFLENP